MVSVLLSKILFLKLETFGLKAIFNCLFLSLKNVSSKSGTVDMVSAAIQKMYDEIAEIEIANSMEKIRVMLGFAPEDYSLKRMKDTFIKNSRNKTLEINPDIVKYNRKIIETSLIPAFCKTKHREGSKEYKKLLEQAFERYENYEYKALKLVKKIS